MSAQLEVARAETAETWAEKAEVEIRLAAEQSVRSHMQQELDVISTERSLLHTRLAYATEAADTKEELLVAAHMVKTALEKVLVAERDVIARTQQVYELRARLAAQTRASQLSASGTLPQPPP